MGDLAVERTKRSVEIVESFCGWDYLLELIAKCECTRDKGLISALFETGGRVSEVLELKKANFVIQEPYIIVKAMPVLKRYEKVGERFDDEGKKRWVTRRKKGYRTFPIHTKEPLCSKLIDHVINLESEHLFRVGRVQVYRIVTGIDKNIFPHWFRAQRASQLAVEYGFDMHDLVDFFNWKSLGTAVHYSRMGWKGLATKMVR